MAMVKRSALSIEDPQFQAPIEILKSADVTFGNMEGNLADLEHFDGPLRGMMGDKDVAPALKAMGFDLMNRANNHIFDSDRESMFSTMEQLDKAGIVHAGTGKNLEDARAPALLRFRRGAASAWSGCTRRTACRAPPSASYESGNIGGRPGLNALDYTVYYNVTADAARGAQGDPPRTRTPPAGTTNVTRLPTIRRQSRPIASQLFGLWYKVGTPGTRSFEMNPDGSSRDPRAPSATAKYLSEFMIATCHCHQGPILAQQWLFEDQIPDFLPSSRARRSTTARTCSSATVRTCCAASKSTRASRSSTGSASSTTSGSTSTPRCCRARGRRPARRRRSRWRRRCQCPRRDEPASTSACPRVSGRSTSRAW